jgi:hypothetical protein
MSVSIFISDLPSPSNGRIGMVLFYCTAVAMKHQDHTPVAHGMEDVFRPGETMEFSGYVVHMIIVNTIH